MDQIFKVMELVMNATVQKSQVMSRQVLNNVRRIIIFIVIALGSMVLFCVGVSMAVSELARQLDRPVMLGSVLAALSLCIFFYCLSQKAWLKTTTPNIENNKQMPSPIEEALGLLIKDFVVERQMKRDSPQEKETPSL